ncbi:MAG: HU family DNA-binding protein [Gammaproteobacteria bacterium]
MNKAELVGYVAQELEMTKSGVSSVLDKLLETVTQTLAKDEEVVLPGFGKFQITHRAARTGRNPQTGAPLAIKASKQPVFKAGKALKDAVQ